jgi:hypothetical protein
MTLEHVAKKSCVDILTDPLLRLSPLSNESALGFALHHFDLPACAKRKEKATGEGVRETRGS